MNYWSKALILLFIIFVGCQNPFNPETFKNDSDDINDLYCSPTTPDSVLKNLEFSYHYKDIELFENCMSDTFKFVLCNDDISDIGIDMNNDGIKDQWWGFQQEIDYHRNMFSNGSSDGAFSSPDQIELSLQIPDQDHWEVDEDGNVIVNTYYDLYLTFYEDLDYFTSGNAQFHLKIEDGEKWKIYKWVDLN